MATNRMNRTTYDADLLYIEGIDGRVTRKHRRGIEKPARRNCQGVA
jgi:hypothetical protein